MPVAYLVLRPGTAAGPDELRAWIATRVPEPAAAPRAVHMIDALPATAVGKTYKPGLVLDSVAGAVRGLLEQDRVSGIIDTELRNGRSHATIKLTEPVDTSALGADLDEYPFTYEIVRMSAP
ncbi:hypothetical protein GCM10010468_05050 [Actinocorallia longicatena]|uniref:AMP-binding enzyme C-terminal domain-containing protein n=1 Tax=Actinocorallia longicatena TaxID=111803 RepID=A0ABP6Q0M3_9ACTN